MKNSMFGKKKEGEKMDPIEKESKMTAIRAMKKMAEDEMSGKLGSLKKVTVASDSPEGLSKGLNKAKELVKSADPEDIEAALGESDEETPEETAEEGEHDMGDGSTMKNEDMPEEAGEFDHLDEAGINDKLEELMKLRDQKKSSKY